MHMTNLTHRLPLARGLAAGALAAVAACGPIAVDADEPFVRDPALNVELSSAATDARSHESFNNCMACHQSGSDGPGLFTVAGTAILEDGSPAVGATVEIRTGPFGDGELLFSMVADTLGNFYTTTSSPMPEEAVFPYLISADGTATAGMPFPTTSGACNLCHVPSLRMRLTTGEHEDHSGHDH
jgi:hypothetical protein